MLNDLWRDVVFAVRSLAKNPGFTAVAVIAIALAIGANTTVYSVVDVLINFPIPADEPSRVALVFTENPERGITQGGVSADDFLDWRAAVTGLDRLVAARQRNFNLVGRGEPVRLQALEVTPGFFDTFGDQLMRGRSFRPEEGEPGRDAVAVLSHSFWQQRFGGGEDALGETLELDGRSYTVIGVAEEDFFFPTRAIALWTPLVLQSGAERRDARDLFVIAKLGRGVTADEASTEVGTIARRFETSFPDTNAGWTARVQTLRDNFNSGTRLGVTVLYGSITLVLLIACANVANLLIARATTREKEVALRTALGAGRLRLVRQLLTESLLLAGTGGVLGLGLGYWGMTVLRRYLAPDPNVGFIAEFIGINTTVLGHTLVVSVLAGVVFGLVPAFQASKSDLQSVLREGGRTAGGGSRRNRLRNTLVVAEVAFALALLGTTGVLIRAFTHIYNVDPGFDPESLLTFQLALSESDYPDSDPETMAAFYRDVLSELEAIPGVRSAASMTSLPLTLFPGAPDSRITVEGTVEEEDAEGRSAVELVVSASYFETMGVSIVEGRGFEARDDADTLPVAVVSREAAARYWPNGDAIGARFKMGDAEAEGPWWTIVGVASDVQTHSHSLRSPSLRRPHVFLPVTQSPRRAAAVALRTTVAPETLSRRAREAVESVDPRQPIDDVTTMRTVIARTDTQNTFFVRLLSSLSVIALVLAGVGIYGIIAYSVNQRAHEIGIRMALGARPSSILSLVVRQAAILTFVGLVIGVGGAVAFTRFVGEQLEGIALANAAGPMTFVGVSLVLIVVAQLASVLPARRAVSLDPLATLRSE